MTAAEADKRLEEADIPSTLIYSAADVAADPQFRGRGMVQEVDDPAFGRPVLHAGVVPLITDDPGAIRWPGAAIGAHTGEVLREIGIGEDAVTALRVEGVL